eukprot:1362738-Amorphochlora_amoeboformis.AAC.1
MKNRTVADFRGHSRIPSPLLSIVAGPSRDVLISCHLVPRSPPDRLLHDGAALHVVRHFPKSENRCPHYWSLSFRAGRQPPQLPQHARCADQPCPMTACPRSSVSLRTLASTLLLSCIPLTSALAPRGVQVAQKSVSLSRVATAGRSTLFSRTIARPWGEVHRHGVETDKALPLRGQEPLAMVASPSRARLGSGSQVARASVVSVATTANPSGMDKSSGMSKLIFLAGGFKGKITDYMKLGALTATGNYFTYAALHYVNYTIRVLFKAAKVVPVMLVSAIYVGK